MSHRAFAVVSVLAIACSPSPSAPAQGDAGPGDDGSTTGPDASDASAGTLAFNIPFALLMAHNTSASATYDKAHFGSNFGPTSWVAQSGTTIPVDPSKADQSLNPVTPAHVSGVDVHTLIPSRPDLRWFAHITPWFRAGGGGGHVDIGLQNDSTPYVQSMLADMKRRGFDGVIIDWYGKSSYEDAVTLRIQQALNATPNETFKFIVMMDKGIANLSEPMLETQLKYCASQYFGDAHYELEGGAPIVMFFGVDAALGPAAMAQAKTNAAANTVWVTQGSGGLSQSWVDQCFDWTHDYKNGVVPSDPYNLAGVKGFYLGVASSQKKVFGSMVAGFNGTLTKSVGWSMGKYLPRGSGACELAWARTIDAVIPKNVTRMQWATWSDWEEGSQIETAIDNDVVLTASLAGPLLTWTVAGGTGDESTLDHYEVYATADGVLAADLGRVKTGAQRSLSLGAVPFPRGAYQVYVKAVGKPNIRDHLSAVVTYLQN